MTYQPLKVGNAVRVSSKNTIMAPTGLNKRDLPQLMDTNAAQSIVNYHVYGQGRLEKRNGSTTVFDETSMVGGTWADWLTEDIILFAYGTTLAYYVISTDTITDLKTDFSANSGFDGARYGSYAYIVNGVDSMQRVEQQITFTGLSQTRVKVGTVASAPTNGQTLQGQSSLITGVVSSFDSATNIITFSSTTGQWSIGEELRVVGPGTVISNIAGVGIFAGDKITGGTSNANAIVATATSTNPTGTFVLKEINGTFQNAELLTANTGETATSSSAVSLAINAVSGAPIGSIVAAIGPRLFIGRLRDDNSAVQYSDVDTGSDPAFSTWTEGTSITSGDTIRYKAAGNVNAILPFGDAILVFQEYGYHAFVISGLDSSGTLSKLNTTIDRRLDYGGATNAINTAEGVFFANRGGLYQMLSVGSKDIPYSGQTVRPTLVLGPEYFENANFANASFLYDPSRHHVYMSYGSDNSETNNAFMAYNTDSSFKGLSEFSGWSLNSMFTLNGEYYGLSSVDGKMYKLFDGTDDDGFDIATEYVQELAIGGLYTVKDTKNVFCDAEMSFESTLGLHFDVYDEFGKLILDKLILEWSPEYANNTEDGWGLSAWGSGAWGGSTSEVGLGGSFSGRSARMRNITRLRIRITGSDSLPHRLNWLSIEYKEKRNARRRNLTKS